MDFGEFLGFFVDCHEISGHLRDRFPIENHPQTEKIDFPAGTNPTKYIKPIACTLKTFLRWVCRGLKKHNPVGSRNFQESS